MRFSLILAGLLVCTPVLAQPRLPSEIYGDRSGNPTRTLQRNGDSFSYQDRAGNRDNTVWRRQDNCWVPYSRNGGTQQPGKQCY